MDDISDLLMISRYAGERFDLVQAGGGNTSQRVGSGKLYVKASGLALNAVADLNDFVCVDWGSLVAFLDGVKSDHEIKSLESAANIAVNAAMQPSEKRPSIETLLHCVLGPLTLHTHPVSVMAFACRQNWRESLSTVVPAAILVDYRTPGVALALELRKKLLERQWQAGDPAIVLLQNHGLIVSAGRAKDVIALTEGVVESLGKDAKVDLKKYKIVDLIGDLVRKVSGRQWIAYLSDDQVLLGCSSEHLQSMLSGTLTPDQLVYCGPQGLWLDFSDDRVKLEAAITQFSAKFGQLPRVIAAKMGAKTQIIVLGPSLQKCKESEEVLKSVALLVRANESANLNYLESAEVAYLSNWEAEKYRQSLKCT